MQVDFIRNGGVGRQAKQCFLYAVPDRTAETLLSYIENGILPETTIISDSEYKTYALSIFSCQS